MRVQAYISYCGRCEEALEFYKKSIGAEIIELMRCKKSPDAAMKAPPGFDEKVMNASFRIGDSLLMADDAEAKRVFTALGEGGKVTMALTKTFWTSSFGMLTDKFGVPWMVNVAAPKA